MLMRRVVKLSESSPESHSTTVQTFKLEGALARAKSSYSQSRLVWSPCYSEERSLLSQASMATASGSKPLRKSCLKRPSCYDDFGDDGPSTSGKPDGVKKQRQSTLQMRPTPVRKSEQPIKKPSESKACPQTTIEIEDDDDDDPVIVDNPNKAGSLDRQKTVCYFLMAC